MDMKPRIITEAIDFVNELYSGNSDGHGADHTMRVYHNAMKLAAEYKECDAETVALAALLHDADDYKLFNTEDNANARRFLSEHQIEPDRIERICSIINSVSFSKNRGKKPSSLEGEIVQDADRLDAIGAVGIARTFAYGGKHGRDLGASVDHFHEKLLLLKDEMNTEAAMRAAEKRHAFMEEFLEEFAKETER